MGKKGFKVKTYEPPDEKFVVVVNAWGKTRDRQQFANAVGAWFEVMLRRIHPKQKLQVNCIYYQSTHDILIVELPSTVTSLSPFLGAHPYRSFLTTHPTSTEFTYVYEYNFRHFNHPENTNWHASAPSYRELPRTLPVKDPYPLPREIEGIGMLPTPPPPMNAKYAIPVPVPVPLPPPSAPIQETRCSPAPAPPPRPSASSSGSSSTTSTLPREHGSDSRTLDPRGRAPSSTPAPAPPQPPPASPSTTDSLFTPYDPPSHHPAHSNLTTARPSGAGKGKERELLAQLQPRSSISTASSGTVDDFLSSILPPPSQPPPRAPPLVRVKTEETLVKLEDEDHVEAVRVKPEPRDDHDPALFASPPPPTHYPSPTARPLRIKAEPLDDSIPERPSAVSWGIQVKPEPSEAEEGAMAALRMPPPPLPTRVKTEPIDDEDIDLGPATAATPTSSRAAGYVRSQSEMWVKQELLLDPSRMRRSESVFGQPESKDVYDPESEERRAGDQEDEREERPGDQEDDYQPSAELLDAFASLEGELGFDLFGATGMEVDSSSQTAASVAESPGKVTAVGTVNDTHTRQ
ncbi:hypothetical protein EST38_g169 [Candolleomyces aberdarensis]|uniref:Uncharacterized protein n=1 Tax=Candolleomyces aberdarensis TaxID=2316362 RepID=A0A4V1Q5I5_9AGAR|nr:hypothetical protein EST38_g169 [Candolleomyces aberdarensis]